MRKTVIGVGESARALAGRLGVPMCALLRANRLFSPAWLLPGREIAVPEDDFCQTDGFPCPARAMRAAAVSRRLYIRRAGETRAQAARTLNVPLRMIPETTNAFSVPDTERGWRVRIAGLHTRLDARERAMNGLYGPIYPGTEIIKHTE